MSVHLFVAAAYLEGLDPSVKWVLAAIADSADEQTLESAPGLPKLRAWSGRSKSQVTRIVADLEASGYIKRLSAGRLGRRAVYGVFPNGVPTIPHPDEVRDRYAAAPVDNVESSPQEDQKEGRTDAPHRGAYDDSWGAPMRPLQSSTSVSIARAADNPPAPPVETRRSASGFPGSRASSNEQREEAQGIARRARGANDVACTLHPGMIVPCGRCAHEAAKVPEAQRLARLAELRATARAATTAPAAPTATTEERSA